MRAGADGGRKKGRKKGRRSAEIKFCRDSLLWGEGGEGGCPCGEVLVREGAVGGRRWGFEKKCGVLQKCRTAF